MSILRVVAVIVFFAWIIIDALAVFRRKTGAAQNRDKFSLSILMIVGMICWPVSIGLAFSSFGVMQDALWYQVAGLALMGVGIALRSLAIWQLGKFHTPNVAILEDHALVDTGLYRSIRHPSYLGALIAILGFGFALGNWFSLAVACAGAFPGYLYRIHEEESALAASLGTDYGAYRKRTKKLIPWIF